MLSIRFNSKSEWWVSGSVLERLFQTGLQEGTIADTEGEWLKIADANGGLNLTKFPAHEVERFVAALRTCAEREVARIGPVREQTDDGSYRISLIKLLEALKEF